jgi:hypothetical protein
MNRQDNLEDLWKTQPLQQPVRGDEMRSIVLKKISAFDRTIRMRNTREVVGAVAVAVYFLFLASVHRNAIELVGNLIVVAGALWIIYYIRRHGAGPLEPAPDQPVESFRRALALKYEHQIRLLRRAKFWYLLPIYVGLLTGSAGLLLEQAKTRPLTWIDALSPLIYTLIFAGLWWVNEVYAVRKLERSRTQILSGEVEAPQF